MKYFRGPPNHNCYLIYIIPWNESSLTLRQVHIPLNVNDNHWMAMVFNFDKEEIQILNSLKNQFDESKETALVSFILLPLYCRMAHELQITVTLRNTRIMLGGGDSGLHGRSGEGWLGNTS